MLFNRLQPAGEPASAEELAAGDGPGVRLNMIATLDGRVAIEGSSRKLGGAGDLALLVALRRWAQALLVGVGTVRAEGYGRIRDDLPVVLCSRTGELPWEAGLFAAAGQPVIVFTDADVEPPPVAAAVEVVRGSGPGRVLAELRRRGHGRVLSEGGPTLNHTMLAQGLVDELFLTLSPLLTGDDAQPRLVEGPPFAAPLEARLTAVAEADGELFLRYALRG